MAWAPDYITVPDLKQYLRVSDNQDDAMMALAVTSASRAIDHATNRQFGVTASVEERVFYARWSRSRGRWISDIDDVQTNVGLVVTVSGSAVTDYVLLPRNADLVGIPWTRLTVSSPTPTTDGEPPIVTVDATFGWTTTPDTIKQATLLQSARFFHRKVSPFGVAGSPEFGSELRLLAKVDPDVEAMVRPYRRDYPLI